MKRGAITISQSRLEGTVAEIERLRAAARQLLTELETAAAGTAAAGSSPVVPGTWRHDPAGWSRRNGKAASSGGAEAAGDGAPPT